MKIKPEKIYFIKLGSKGGWEKESIDVENTIKLGFHNPLHNECLKGEWDKVNEYWLTEKGKKLGKATETTNQIKYFYESSPETMWITFYKRKLYWCFAQQKVNKLKDGSRIRKTEGKWSSKDIEGNELFVENLRGSLTKVQGFRGTICNVKESKYLINRINCITSPEVKNVESNLENLKLSLKPLLKGLNWKDFEVLIDMIFTSAGWQRISARGKTEKSIDLTLISPVNNRRAFVQIKSTSSFDTFKDSLNSFNSMEQYDEMYYVVHSADLKLLNYKSSKNINLISIDKIVELVINAGLTNWLLDRVK